MKKRSAIVLLFWIGCSGYAIAQGDLEPFNLERQNINRSGMLVLGSWALVNLATSPILASRSKGVERSFHQMNGYWNTVNLVIAGFGYYSAVKGEMDLSLAENIREQQSIEKILLFNTALDLGYITGGFLLRERAKSVSRNSNRLKGFGNSLILQGGFLLAFDVTLYLIHQTHSEFLFKLIEQVLVTPAGFAISWKV